MCPCSLDAARHDLDLIDPITALLPQSGDMVLVDRVVEVGDSHIVVALTVRDDGLFSLADQTVPAWVGMEYMAQTVAAFSGYHRLRRGEPVGLGFLLGTRHYQSSVAAFRCGEQLQVHAERIIETDDDMSVFSCQLSGSDVEAHCRLNLLLPRDSRKFLVGKGL